MGSNVAILFGANVMGMYFVASVLLFRLNLPEVYRKVITGNLERRAQACCGAN
jgi:hypothetical protein